MIYLKALATFSLLGSIAWAVTKPSFESVLAVAASMSALVGLFVTDRKKTNKSSQTQNVSSESVGIQAGGDVNIGTTKRDN